MKQTLSCVHIRHDFYIRHLLTMISRTCNFQIKVLTTTDDSRELSIYVWHVRS